MRVVIPLAAAAVACGVFIQSASACSSCGCSFNSDWASEGYASCSGMKFDVRFDYIDQDDLRRGGSSVSEHELLGHTDEMVGMKHEGMHEEDPTPAMEDGHSHAAMVQHGTLTKQTLLSFDYSPEQNWGVRISLPYLDRTHTAYGDGSEKLSRSEASGLGDLRLIARRDGGDSWGGIGVEFGIKLPSGEFDDTFDSGSMAGEKLDRGLQLGTGTTDLIFGFYRYSKINEKVDLMLHAALQQSLAKRDDFAPGTAITASAGVGFRVSESLRPQLQLNFRHEERETGSEADLDNSGMDLVYLSPGITFSPSEKTKLYAIVQLPLYERVNGVQLLPDVMYSAGVRFSL